jgi:hypothetical protein
MLPVGQAALDPSNEHLAAPMRATVVKRAFPRKRLVKTCTKHASCHGCLNCLWPADRLFWT